MTITFDIIGTPAPQGSKRAFVVAGRARMTEAAGSKGVAWRDAVASEAKRQAEVHGRIEHGVLVVVTFRFAMPKSRKAAQRARGIGPKTTAPDVDKLLRSLFDGLQAGGLLADDALVVEVRASKREVTDWTGAHVVIAPWEMEEVA